VLKKIIGLAKVLKMQFLYLSISNYHMQYGR